MAIGNMRRPRRAACAWEYFRAAAYDLVVNVASGHVDSVDAIAAILQTATQPRKQDKTVQRAASGTPGYLA